MAGAQPHPEYTHTEGRLVDRKSRFSLRLETGIAILLGTFITGVASAAITADEANDVCPSSADPCFIAQTVNVVPGSTLDFGTRTVHLNGGGQLNIGNGSATLSCGELVADAWSNGPRIKVKSSGQGGTLEVVARRGCSGDPAVACRGDSECADAGLGICSAGTGNITISGNVRGEGDPAASVSFLAYESFSSTGVINLRNGGSTPNQTDGGNLEITAEAGSVTVSKRIELNGGGSARGGDLFIQAGGDIIVGDEIDATGGDSGGGTISLAAGGNISVNSDLRVRADLGEGIGGSISLDASGDITLTGVAATNRTILDADGHASSGEFGSGGEVMLSARGKITVNDHVLLRANGVAAGSEGGVIEITACDLEVQDGAEFQATGEEGGALDLTGADAITVRTYSYLAATGQSAGDDGSIRLITRSFGHCANDPSTSCTVNSDCTVGCNAYECLENPDTEGTLAQFDQVPEMIEVVSLPACE
jgi:hypothetical protein